MMCIDWEIQELYRRAGYPKTRRKASDWMSTRDHYFGVGTTWRFPTWMIMRWYIFRGFGNNLSLEHWRKNLSGLITLFGEHVIKKGLMSREFAEILGRALDMRLKSDYEVFTHFEEQEVEKLIVDAEKFVRAGKQLLKLFL